MSSLKQTSTGSCGRKCFKSFPPLVFHVRSSHDLMLREDPAFTCLETKWKFIAFCLLLEEEKCVSLSSGLGILITLLHLGSNSIVSLSPTNTLKQLLIQVFLPHSWSLGVQSDTLSLSLSLPSSHFSFFFSRIERRLLLLTDSDQKSFFLRYKKRKREKETVWKWEVKTPPNIPGLSLAASLSLRAWRKFLVLFVIFRAKGCSSFCLLSLITHVMLSDHLKWTTFSSSFKQISEGKEKNLKNPCLSGTSFSVFIVSFTAFQGKNRGIKWHKF